MLCGTAGFNAVIALLDELTELVAQGFAIGALCAFLGIAFMSTIKHVQKNCVHEPASRRGMKWLGTLMSTGGLYGLMITQMFHLPVVGASSSNARAGGAGYAYAFDGRQRTTIAMQWQTEPLSQVTIEYWVNVLDTAVSWQGVFAYSSYSITGRYGQGGPPYENGNELLLLHHPSLLRMFRATVFTDLHYPSVFDRAGSWVHVAVAWTADPSASPHGQLAMYVDGIMRYNTTMYLAAIRTRSWPFGMGCN